MAFGKVSMLMNAIKNNNIVEIIFVIGKNGDGNNEIQYIADVVDIITDPDGAKSPEKALTPDEWNDDKNEIWIKVKNLISYTKLTTKDFIVVSSGKILQIL